MADDPHRGNGGTTSTVPTGWPGQVQRGDAGFAVGPVRAGAIIVTKHAARAPGGLRRSLMPRARSIPAAAFAACAVLCWSVALPTMAAAQDLVKARLAQNLGPIS